MGYRIDEIEGIGRAFAEKLTMVGIRKTDDLLRTCGDSRGRRETSERTGIGEATLLKWANRADLMRISGVGRQYSELLEAAGVDTVRELATRKAENLVARIVEVNKTQRLARVTPTASVIQGWIDQATKLEPAITH